MKRSSALWGLLSVLAFVLALYCFAGYAMNASFSVAAGSGRDHGSAAVLWGCAGLVSLGLAVGLAIAAWRRARSL